MAPQSCITEPAKVWYKWSESLVCLNLDKKKVSNKSSQNFVVIKNTLHHIYYQSKLLFIRI